MVGWGGGSLAVPGSGPGAQWRFSHSQTLSHCWGLPGQRLPPCTPGPHLLLFEVHKRLLIYRQKGGMWHLGLFPSGEDELWWREALLSRNKSTLWCLSHGWSGLSS